MGCSASQNVDQAATPTTSWKQADKQADNIPVVSDASVVPKASERVAAVPKQNPNVTLIENAKRGSLTADLLSQLVDAKADVNYQDERGCTPLSYASQGVHLHCVELLIGAGSDPNTAKCPFSDTATTASVSNVSQHPIDGVPFPIVAKQCRENLKQCQMCPDWTTSSWPEKLNLAAKVQKMENLDASEVLQDPRNALMADSMALDVDDEAPDMDAMDQHGELFDLDEKLEQVEKALVVIFYRGAWCMACHLALREYASRLPELRAAGAEVVAVSPELPQAVKLSTDLLYADGEVKRDADHEFPVLSDPHFDIIRPFGLSFAVSGEFRVALKEHIHLDLCDYYEIETADDVFVPIPAVYVIDKERDIKWKHLDLRWHVRPTVDSILEALEDID